jgi:hypothetical protein
VLYGARIAAIQKGQTHETISTLRRRSYYLALQFAVPRVARSSGRTTAATRPARNIRRSINHKDTIGKLTVAWRWTSPDNAVIEANPTARPAAYADTPLMVKGVLYTVTSLGQNRGDQSRHRPDDLDGRSRQLEDGPAPAILAMFIAASPTGAMGRSNGCCSARTTPI